jgi:hypothetical protein
VPRFCMRIPVVGSSTADPKLPWTLWMREAAYPEESEVDYLINDRAEIYVGRSRHGAVVWVWFLS